MKPIPWSRWSQDYPAIGVHLRLGLTPTAGEDITNMVCEQHSTRNPIDIVAPPNGNSIGMESDDEMLTSSSSTGEVGDVDERLSLASARKALLRP